MKAIVDQESCIGCGMCIDICPEIFGYNNEDKSESLIDVIPDDVYEKASEAKDVCPVEAIEIEN